MSSPSRRKILWLLVLLPPLLWLACDAIHALRIRTLAAAEDARHAPANPFCLNPEGSPAVLMIHGFADGPDVFRSIAPTLADAGMAVRAMHLDGCGCPPRQMKGITLERWRKNIDTEIAALRMANPDRPVWLIGHSLGGTLAFDAALRPANRIEGLVLLAPLIRPSDARSPLLSSRQWFRLLSSLLVFSDIVESRMPPDLHDPDARTAYRTDQFIHRDIYAALFAAADAVRTRAADWHGPLLMIVSPSDQVVDTPASTHFFFAATNAAPARLIEHHSGGHVLPLDTGHEKIARKIVAFIRNTQQL